MRIFLFLLFTMCCSLAHAAGTLPVAMAQQVDQNGRPLVGALLYIYVVGTVSTPQNAFQDTALTMPLPWPVQADANGRLPMFYLADGSVHARLTDAAGGVQFDYPTLLVIGPSGGGGGGGGTVDATAIASTGDIKWRPGAEVLPSWVRANGNSIGSATSGATERANADTQTLFVWLWTNCIDANCAVSGGRGATALADFSANKTINTPDMRSSATYGRDCMGGVCAGETFSSDVAGTTITFKATGGVVSILFGIAGTWYLRL